MQLAKDIKKDMKVAKKMWLPWWGVLCLIIGGLPIAWLFDHFGRSNLALPTLIGVGMLGLIAAIKWKLRRRAWFWITMTVIVALHVLLILSVPWTTKWVPAIAITPIGIADLYVMLAILSVVEHVVENPKPLKNERPRT
jgi:hypothetical protein